MQTIEQRSSSNPSRSEGEILTSSTGLFTYDQHKQLFLAEHQTGSNRFRSSILAFPEISADQIVYNITGYRTPTGAVAVLGRLEQRQGGKEFSDVRRYDPSDRGWVQNGLHIEAYQDASISELKTGQVVIGGTKLKADPADPEKIATFWAENYLLTGDSGYDANWVIAAPEKEKNVRWGNMGDRWVALGIRERQDNEGAITSFLQVGLVPISTDPEKYSQHLRDLKENSTARLDLLEPDEKTWFGPGRWYKLQSQRGEIRAGLEFHTGRWEGQSEGPREYADWSVELSFDPDSGQLVKKEDLKMIATTDIIDVPYVPKETRFNRVFFSGGSLFVVSKEGVVKQTVTLGGIGDSTSVALLREGSIFNTPIDPEYNQLYIINEAQAALLVPAA